jgi:hypothetical protein
LNVVVSGAVPIVRRQDRIAAGGYVVGVVLAERSDRGVVMMMVVLVVEGVQEGGEVVDLDLEVDVRPVATGVVMEIQAGARDREGVRKEDCDKNGESTPGAPRLHRSVLASTVANENARLPHVVSGRLGATRPFRYIRANGCDERRAWGCAEKPVAKGEAGECC